MSPFDQMRQDRQQGGVGLGVLGGPLERTTTLGEKDPAESRYRAFRPQGSRHSPSLSSPPSLGSTNFQQFTETMPSPPPTAAAPNASVSPPRKYSSNVPIPGGKGHSHSVSLDAISYPTIVARNDLTTSTNFTPLHAPKPPSMPPRSTSATSTSSQTSSNDSIVSPTSAAAMGRRSSKSRPPPLKLHGAHTTFLSPLLETSRLGRFLSGATDTNLGESDSMRAEEISFDLIDSRKDSISDDPAKKLIQNQMAFLDRFPDGPITPPATAMEAVQSEMEQQFRPRNDSGYGSMSQPAGSFPLHSPTRIVRVPVPKLVDEEVRQARQRAASEDIPQSAQPLKTSFARPNAGKLAEKARPATDYTPSTIKFATRRSRPNTPNAVESGVTSSSPSHAASTTHSRSRSFGSSPAARKIGIPPQDAFFSPNTPTSAAATRRPSVAPNPPISSVRPQSNASSVQISLAGSAPSRKFQPIANPILTNEGIALNLQSNLKPEEIQFNFNCSTEIDVKGNPVTIWSISLKPKIAVAEKIAQTPSKLNFAPTLSAYRIDTPPSDSPVILSLPPSRDPLEFSPTATNENRSFQIGQMESTPAQEMRATTPRRSQFFHERKLSAEKTVNRNAVDYENHPPNVISPAASSRRRPSTQPRRRSSLFRTPSKTETANENEISSGDSVASSSAQHDVINITRNSTTPNLAYIVKTKASPPSPLLQPSLISWSSFSNSEEKTPTKIDQTFLTGIPKESLLPALSILHSLPTPNPAEAAADLTDDSEAEHELDEMAQNRRDTQKILARGKQRMMSKWSESEGSEEENYPGKTSWG